MLQAQNKCLAHPSQSLDFYCQLCRTLACTSCVLSPAHRSHSPDVTDALELLPSHKAKLQEYINQANGVLQGAENMMDNSAGSLQTLQENFKRAEAKIQKYFYRMRTILTDRERHFCNELKKSVSEKKKSFSEQRNTLKTSLSGIIEGMKALDELLQRSDEDILLLRDEVSVIDKLQQHMKGINYQVESNDLANFDTTVTMPCFEDYNFEIICRQVGDPDYRVCVGHNSTLSPSSVAPPPPFTLSPNVPEKRKRSKTDITEDVTSPPPIPPRPPSRKKKSSSFEDSTSNSTSSTNFMSPLSPTGSFNSDTELTESGETDVFSISVSDHTRGAPPLPPKSPNSSKKSIKLPPWIEDYKKKYDAEKERGCVVVTNEDKHRHENGIAPPTTDTQPPPIPPKSPTLQLKTTNKSVKSTNNDFLKTGKENIITNSSGSISPVPKPRRKLTNLKEGDTPPQQQKLVSNTDTKVTVQPPTPVSPPPLSPPLTVPSLEITSKMMLGSMENKEEQIMPCGVCIGTDNVMIVTDKSSSFVRILKTTGKLLDILGKDCDINEPVAVTTDGSGNIYVVDRSPSPKILKFTKTGTFVSKIVSKTLRNSILGDPRGLVVTHDGQILVSDWEKSCVHIFDSSGRYEDHFRPSNCDQFQPTCLCVDTRGRVLVTDYANHHIWIFTPKGDLLHHFGWEGQNPGDLYYPYGIIVDLKGRIIVSESGNHRISVFSNSGSFLKCFGEYGNQPGQFHCPLNICISHCGGKLIVADEGNGRLQVFDKILF